MSRFRFSYSFCLEESSFFSIILLYIWVIDLLESSVAVWHILIELRLLRLSKLWLLDHFLTAIVHVLFSIHFLNVRIISTHLHILTLKCAWPHTWCSISRPWFKSIFRSFSLFIILELKAHNWLRDPLHGYIRFI